MGGLRQGQGRGHPGGTGRRRGRTGCGGDPPLGHSGPYDDGNNHLVHMIKTFLAGKLPGSVNGGYDFVDVRDVAKGCLLAA